MKPSAGDPACTCDHFTYMSADGTQRWPIPVKGAASGESPIEYSRRYAAWVNEIIPMGTPSVCVCSPAHPFNKKGK